MANNYFLYDWDENDKIFFEVPKGQQNRGLPADTAEDLYEYLAEESEGFSLIAMKARS